MGPLAVQPTSWTFETTEIWPDDHMIPNRVEPHILQANELNMLSTCQNPKQEVGFKIFDQ